MTRRESVLIVGGGIGGLSAAVALRESGRDVHVVEIQPDMRSSVFGVGIIQPANALRALDAIGCADECIAQGYPGSVWMRIYDAGGELIKEFPGDRGSGFPPMNGITRPRLHRILTDRALHSGVQIEYGKTITSLEGSDDGVDVAFSDSTERGYDVVVGADGVYSKVRDLVHPGISPIYVGQSAFRTNIPRLPEVDCIVVQRSSDRTAGIVPLAPELAYIFLNTDWDRQRRPGTEDMYDILRELLEPFGGIIGRIRDEHIGEASDIVLRPEEYLIAPRPWHKGRVVLLGDAVHAVTPTLAQGAAQAIEDGIVLAEELSVGGELEEALERYADRRYERCKLIVEGCARLGERGANAPSQAEDLELRQMVLRAVAAPI